MPRIDQFPTKPSGPPDAINPAFGDGLHFVGEAHGIVPLLVVVVAMLVAEELLVRLYRRLA